MWETCTTFSKFGEEHSGFIYEDPPHQYCELPNRIAPNLYKLIFKSFGIIWLISSCMHPLIVREFWSNPQSSNWFGNSCILAQLSLFFVCVIRFWTFANDPFGWEDSARIENAAILYRSLYVCLTCLAITIPLQWYWFLYSINESLEMSVMSIGLLIMNIYVFFQSDSIGMDTNTLSGDGYMPSLTTAPACLMVFSLVWFVFVYCWLRRALKLVKKEAGRIVFARQQRSARRDRSGGGGGGLRKERKEEEEDDDADGSEGEERKVASNNNILGAKNEEEKAIDDKLNASLALLIGARQSYPAILIPNALVLVLFLLIGEMTDPGPHRLLIRICVINCLEFWFYFCLTMAFWPSLDSVPGNKAARRRRSAATTKSGSAGMYSTFRSSATSFSMSMRGVPFGYSRASGSLSGMSFSTAPSHFDATIAKIERKVDEDAATASESPPAFTFGARKRANNVIRPVS